MDTPENIVAKIATTKKALGQLEYALFQETRKAKIAPKKTTKEMRQEKYKTKNGLTIHNLRQAGNTVKITHIRYTQMEGVGVLVPVPSYLRKLTDFYPRGGVTYIIITTPEKNTHSAVAVCNEVDCFDYRTGVKIALDRFSEATARELLAPLEAVTEHTIAPVIIEEKAEASSCSQEAHALANARLAPEETKSCMA